MRWWLLRAPAPATTTDFTIERLVAAYNQDLANTLGNLAARTLTLSRRHRARRAATTVGVGADLRAQTAALPTAVDHALARYDFRSACAAIVALAEAGNRFIEAEAPWQLVTRAEAGDGRAAERFAAVIDTVLTACRVAADELGPFLPRGGGPACRTTRVARDETRAGISPLFAMPGSAVTYCGGRDGQHGLRAAARIWSDSSPGPMPRATRTAPTSVLSAVAARARSPSSASRWARYRSTWPA